MRPGKFEIATTASSTRVAVDGASGTRRELPHHREWRGTVDPVAWLTTSAASGPSRSSAHNDVAQYGMSRAALLEPSIGSITTVIAPSVGPVMPDSSLTTVTGKGLRMSNATRSATRSIAY